MIYLWYNEIRYESERKKMINIEKEYKLLQDLSFVRVSGRGDEEKAADLIVKALEAEGLAARKETFEVDSFNVESGVLEVLAPFTKQYDVTTYANCGTTPEGGLEAELCYFESDNEVCRKNVKGKIALVNGYLGRAVYKALVECGAVGFISFSGDIDKSVEVTDIDTRELRAPLRDLGVIPGVHMRVHDVMEMMDAGASKVKFTVNQEVGKAESCNVVCEIKGTEDTKETIVFTGHYDSVPFSKGAYDNATGSVCLYALAMYFKDHAPKRNLVFVFCGSEERGLLGSKAYCAQHEDELENVVYCINVDMIGCTLGRRIAVATADEKVVSFTDYFAKIVGFPISASQGVYSSDSTPFADKGVPAISFARITPQGGGSIHNRFDVMEHLSARYLGEDTEFICKYAETLANSYVFPIKKEMPQKMKDELDKYLGRDKKDDAKNQKAE